MSERRKHNVTEPLFGLIDQYPLGVEETPGRDDGRVRLIARGDKMLEHLGVDRNIVRGVRAAAKFARPFGRLTLVREPLKSERSILEGRGHRHHGIPVPVEGGAKNVTLYVKGGGNKETFEKNGGSIFPGFPNTTENLFFDDISKTGSGRVRGTQTVTWGIIEMINAATILAGVSKEHDWTSFEQALEAEVTIPLQVSYLPGLSQHVRELIAQKKTETKTTDEKARAAMEWEPNHLGVGTITQIVPGTKRMYETVRDQGVADKELRKKWSDPEIPRTIGRTMRELFDAGFVYSKTSAHGQNLYERGLVAQADSSDLVFLGDVADTRFTKEPLNTEQKRWQHAYLLFLQLFTNNEPQATMTPYIYPETKKGWPIQTMQEAQKTFWNELLRGYAHPDAIDGLVTLMPFMHREIVAAISATMVDGAGDKVQTWEALAAPRRELMETYKDFKVTEEYDASVGDEIKPSESKRFSEVIQNDKLSHLRLMYFLQSGEITDLLEDKEIASLYELAKAIESIKNTTVRDRLMQNAGKYFNGRGLDVLMTEPDNTASFEGTHALLMVDYIKQGEYKKAEAVVSVLTDVTDPQLRNETDFDGSAERLDHYYSRRLLDEDPIELDEEIKFARFILETMNRFTGDFRKIFISEISAYRQSRNNRNKLFSIVDKCNQLIDMRDTPEVWALEKLAQGLEIEALRLADVYPFLPYLHAYLMGAVFIKSNIELSNKYGGKAYSGLYPLQSEYIPSTEDHMQESQREVSEMYAELGFPLLARRYQALADGEENPDLWQTGQAA